jgi:hypothetical protein
MSETAKSAWRWSPVPWRADGRPFEARSRSTFEVLRKTAELLEAVECRNGEVRKGGE